MKLTKQARIFVTGCGGMLGEAVYEILHNKAIVLATDIEINAPFLKYCDVKDYTDVRNKIVGFKPDIIFHLAALTNLEYCELHPDDAWETNALSTERIAYLADELGIPLVYISTAGIFDGENKFYNDYDFPNPLCIYAKSKYAGELAVQRIVKNHFIFRPGWMMGGGPEKDKKFVNKIMKQINAGAKILKIVDDKLGTPTYTFDFVKNALLVIENDLYGLYNLVCEGACSRYDVALEIVKILGRKDIRIEKVKSDFFQNEYFATRPKSEMLTPFKLKKMNLYTMRDWKVCLKEYLKRWLAFH